MSQPPISRGFRGRRPEAHTERIPPGQHLTSDFPVLSAGPTPHTDLESWSFSLYDDDTVLAEWSWVDFEALRQTGVKVDIHCVTTWSKLDTQWQGVTIDTLFDAAGLEVKERQASVDAPVKNDEPQYDLVRIPRFNDPVSTGYAFCSTKSVSVSQDGHLAG
jgi:DMSO/TMAO reductase YedYZ molybdopterin-dependent catalytic subunit